MTKDDLKPFCGWRYPSPWSDENYTYASNGSFLIRVARIEDLPAASVPPVNIEKIIDDAVVSDLKPFPPIDGIKGEKCRPCNGTGQVVESTCTECDGDGEVQWFNGKHDYEADCKGCDGTGKMRTPSSDGETCENCHGTGIDEIINRIQIDGFSFDSNLLYHFSLLPDAMIGIKKHNSNDSGVAYVTFDGGIGVIMGLRD